MIDVTVIVVTYEPEWFKLKATLTSIIKQKQINFEVIISDDGSKNVYNKEIHNFMKENEFTRYKIINTSVNQGTVKNILKGIKNGSGRYTKTIAPGDCLYSNYTLYEWVKYMDEKKIDVCFGDAVYYQNSSEVVEVIPSKGCPVLNNLFSKTPLPLAAYVDYLLANDTILGAAQMMKTDLMLSYLNIIENKVIYAEDFMIRIMLFDGLEILYFPQIVIWYEYGTGISTSKNNKWKDLLQKDFDYSDRIILERESSTNRITRRYRRFLIIKNRIPVFSKLIKCLFFPSVIIYRFLMRFAESKILEVNIDFIKDILATGGI